MRRTRLNTELHHNSALLAYARRAALGIGLGATAVMVAAAIGKLMGYPTHDIGDAAFTVWFIAVAVYFGCVGLARLADRRRGL